MRTFATEKQFRTICEEYFEDHTSPIYMRDPDSGRLMKDTTGRPIIENMNEPTLLGLCLALGLSSHIELHKLKNDPTYSDVASWAILKVSEGYERMIQSPHVRPTGLITAFKSLFAIDIEDTRKGAPEPNKNKGYRVVYRESKPVEEKPVEAGA